MLDSQKALLEEIAALPGPDERFEFLIRLGRSEAALANEFKIDKYRIQGCTSQLWLVPAFKDGLVTFTCDSDATIPKGLGVAVCRLHSGLSPIEVIAVDPTALEKAGVSQHLSMNRRNGLSSLLKQIRSYAAVFQALSAQGLKEWKI